MRKTLFLLLFLPIFAAAQQVPDSRDTVPGTSSPIVPQFRYNSYNGYRTTYIYNPILGKYDLLLTSKYGRGMFESLSNKTNTISGSTTSYPSVKAVQDALSFKADTSLVNTKSGISSQYTTIPGQKRKYSQTPYTTTGNFMTVNSAFTTGDITGWTAANLTDASANPLYSVVSMSGKNWVRIDNGTAGATGNTGTLTATISVPAESRNSVLEISFLIGGLFNQVNVNNEEFTSLYYNIDPAKPERVYYYFNPNGASTFNIKFSRAYANALVTGAYTYITELLVKEASYTNIDIAKGIPATGGTIQVARWINSWDEAKQEKIISNSRKLGGLVRLWLSADMFAAYTIKNSPTKRTSVPNGNLTSQYVARTTANVPNGLDPSKTYKMDWIFKKLREYGLKVHVLLGAGFGDGIGNPSSTLSTQGTYEFLDTDTDVQNGFLSLFTTVVNRYKTYENIIGWEIGDEGYPTWSYDYSGVSKVTGTAYHHGVMFAGYKVFERLAYTAIKTADPLRPVILNTGGVQYQVGQGFFNDNTICDWYCPSVYPGAFSVTPALITGGNTFQPAQGYSQLLTGVSNNQSVIVYKPTGVTLPTGLTDGQRYYFVSLNAFNFKLSLTPGGSAISVSGGSGEFWLYMDTEAGAGLSDYAIRQATYNPKFTYFSEYGASILPFPKFLYRDDAVNSQILIGLYKRLSKFGSASAIAFVEPDLYFNETTGVFNESGKNLISFSSQGVNWLGYSPNLNTSTPINDINGTEKATLFKSGTFTSGSLAKFDASGNIIAATPGADYINNTLGDARYLQLSGGTLTGGITGTTANFSGQVAGQTFVNSSYGGTLIAGDASFGNVKVSAINSGPFIGATSYRNGVPEFQWGSNAGGTAITNNYWNGSSWANLYAINSSGANFTVPVTATAFNGNATSATNATTVTNGLYNTGSYSNPSWITSLAYSKLTGAPTAVSAFTNDAGYLTNITGLDLTTSQTISSGVKTFAVSPIVPTPTTSTQAANKGYVDANIPAITQVNSATLATGSSVITSYAVTTTGTFSIGGYVNINAITLGSSSGIKYLISYTDLNGVGQSVDFYAPGTTSSTLSTAIDHPFQPIVLRAQGGTNIIVATNNVGGIPTFISYNAGVIITKY